MGNPTTENLTTWTIESAFMHYERQNRRLWILCLVLIVILLGTNIGWLYYESQFTDTEITQEVDTGDGDAEVISVNGGDYYGKGETNSQN